MNSPFVADLDKPLLSQFGPFDRDKTKLPGSQPMVEDLGRLIPDSSSTFEKGEGRRAKKHRENLTTQPGVRLSM
jgi:hypothetical protein